MDAFNGAEESMGIAWSDSFYNQYQTSGGLYRPCSDGYKDGIDIYQSDGVPKVGNGWSWHEWTQHLCNPRVTTAMEYSRGDVYVREDTWKGGTAEVVMKYFHKWGGSSYALSMSAAGPTISIIPTSNQWSLAVGTTFSH